MGASQDNVGYTETDTLCREAAWASYWLNRIAKDYKAMREAIIACKNMLVDGKDTNIDSKSKAVKMMLSGVIKDSNDSYIDDGENILDAIIRSATIVHDIGQRKQPIPVHEPIDIDSEDVKVDAYDTKMFEQTVNEFLRNREALQKLFDKYYSKFHPVVQMRLDIVNGRGETVKTDKFDMVPIINAYMQRKMEEKFQSGQVVGLNAEPTKPETPKAIPDDNIDGNQEIPPPPPSEPGQIGG